MIDFAITKNGDLLFQEQEKSSNPLMIKFSLSKTKALRVNFDLMDFLPIKESDTALKLSFNVERKRANKTVTIYKDNEAKAQMIELNLKTVLGELPLRNNFGSSLSIVKHNNIDERSLSLVKRIILNVVSKYLYDPKVEVEPIIDYANGYKQTVQAVIYEKEKVILSYKVER